jgi:FdrA protein
MRLSEALASQPGVLAAAAVMATPLNVELLADDGLLPPEINVTADDLLIAVRAESESAADDALSQVDALLAPRIGTPRVRTSGVGAPRAHREAMRSEANPSPAADTTIAPPTIEEAVRHVPADLAVIAVPGPLAAAEAFAALRAGLHVFLFSDNVSLEDEIRLKALAARRDLLMMGPDCGTAIINGVGLGFANRVETGPVGIAGASGTGIQQVCCLLDAGGIGIAQAIGTGGRDLSAEVGGSMTRRALHLLEEDVATEVIVLISKPADAAVADALHHDLRASRKPVVACLLGTVREPEGAVRYARTLSEAAGMAAEALGVALDSTDEEPPARRHAGFHSRVYGLFTGGTLSTEAAGVLEEMGVPHALVDLGADEYTRGRAHPMIDPRFRASLLPDIGRHGDAGALLLDVVLGDLAHPDPAGALVPAVEDLRATGWSQEAGSTLPILAVLVGTRRDPQNLQRQREILESAGMRVFTSNAHAAAAAGALVGGNT